MNEVIYYQHPGDIGVSSVNITTGKWHPYLLRRDINGCVNLFSRKINHEKKAS